MNSDNGMWQGENMQFSRSITRFFFFLSVLFLCDFHTVAAAVAAPGQVNHVVLLWFKNGTSAQQVQHIIEQTRGLAKIKEIKKLSVGRAIPSQRPIVDDSFQLGIYMQFNNVAEMNRYLQNKKHVQFVQQHIKPHIRKIVVYDF